MRANVYFTFMQNIIRRTVTNAFWQQYGYHNNEHSLAPSVISRTVVRNANAAGFVVKIQPRHYIEFIVGLILQRHKIGRLIPTTLFHVSPFNVKTKYLIITEYE